MRKIDGMVLCAVWVCFLFITSDAAQTLPEIAVQRSKALCGTDALLPGIMSETHRAIKQNRLSAGASPEIGRCILDDGRFEKTLSFRRDLCLAFAKYIVRQRIRLAFNSSETISTAGGGFPSRSGEAGSKPGKDV